MDGTNARSPEVVEISRRLAEPFDVREVKFKPQAVKNNRALAIAYVDVRLIEDRLDEVVGVENWQDDYEILPDGSVSCRLRVNLAGQWVTKMDVGSPSEQPDGGDRMKAAFSDALKRVAVKFGIGRYLYRLPMQWVEYDPAKKQIVAPPQLPAFAVKKSQQNRATTGAAPPPSPPALPPGPPLAPPPQLPATGAELHRRLQDYDAKLAGNKVSNRGALLAHVTACGVRAGYPADMTEWAGEAIAAAAGWVREFESDTRRPG